MLLNAKWLMAKPCVLRILIPVLFFHELLFWTKRKKKLWYVALKGTRLSSRLMKVLWSLCSCDGATCCANFVLPLLATSQGNPYPCARNSGALQSEGMFAILKFSCCYSLHITWGNACLRHLRKLIRNVKKNKEGLETRIFRFLQQQRQWIKYMWQIYLPVVKMSWRYFPPTPALKQFHYAFFILSLLYF